METKAFIEYLEEFPSIDRTMVNVFANFQWTTPNNRVSDGNASRGPHIAKDLIEIFSYFLVVEHRGYFGPRGQASK